LCLHLQHGAAADEDENVDVEGDNEMYEEYEWAGQRRIRATTLLVGGFAGECCNVKTFVGPAPCTSEGFNP
jgi:hypothetical protein